jgi:hypothetical protein
MKKYLILALVAFAGSVFGQETCNQAFFTTNLYPSSNSSDVTYRCYTLSNIETTFALKGGTWSIETTPLFVQTSGVSYARVNAYDTVIKDINGVIIDDDGAGSNFSKVEAISTFYNTKIKVGNYGALGGNDRALVLLKSYGSSR